MNTTSLDDLKVRPLVDVRGAINKAIEALTLACEMLSGSADVLARVGEAKIAMETLRVQMMDALRDQADMLDGLPFNQADDPPTGDGYNDLMILNGINSGASHTEIIGDDS